MPEKHLYEYAVIRVIPRVEREEFMNVGVILYCHSEQFLKTLYFINPERLAAFYEKTELAELEERLQAFVCICNGKDEGGTIGALPMVSRFRWLTSARSTVVQTSPVHSGLCLEAEKTLEGLYQDLVL